MSLDKSETPIIDASLDSIGTNKNVSTKTNTSDKPTGEQIMEYIQNYKKDSQKIFEELRNKYK